ncbi:hypothetical protein BX616_010213 [Lobosporangium transversale]|uniref:Prolyl 4-hydroxylase alpha subunit Fe(2+) 2OG dioxygenase domain-containing protein n=1 Tax=Lobosporangium transversale TaxID=64571 RepID=A0A1Y2H0L8_9FUNG|nr:hypothetical protein BCR41DRAFT_344649 [Lobosporangium transversale]KAF9912867.1 hypothetical protein BX616_010213 [Lobosporangium transversale]ORZ28100.1 hypothetical protein BCR41DRAFT_344649 [Lobosporangium transversale]|eukprot:XP_021885785.1 hypothetical protein BCR41DRAFT_344649 [Lobosporangium transversale]
MDDELNVRSLYGEEELTENVIIWFGAKSVQFPLAPDNISKISELVESCVPSGFGVNERTVFDNSYRNCKELKPKDFTLSNNYHELIPKFVADIANILESSKPIYASLNKICVYETHGFFKEHVDTPRSNIFASLVVCLPTGYEGGMLVVEDSAYDLSSTKAIKWCAFYPDCKHRIDEVTKGFRVTLTYDLLYLDLPKPTPYHDRLYITLEKSLRDLHTKYPGYVIGIGLANKYPTPSQQKSGGHRAKPILKGRDLRVVSILRNLGYTTDIKAVFNVEARNVSEYDGKESDAFPKDIYQVRKLVEERGNREDVYVLSDDWDGWHEEFYQDGEDSAIKELYEHGGRCIENLIWLSEPQSWHAGPSYITYGNEPGLGFVYKDGCILAYKQEKTTDQSD